MSSVDELLQGIINNPKDVRFVDLCKVCEYCFGGARQKSSSHRIYKTPWQGNPRINIQDDNGKAKEYQVKQVLKAIEKLGALRDD